MGSNPTRAIAPLLRLCPIQPALPLTGLSRGVPGKTKEVNEMRLRLARVAARPQERLRPARVIALEARRSARLERKWSERLPSRPAA